MKQGNTTLYVIMAVVALAVIAFLVIQNKQFSSKNSEEMTTDNSSDTSDQAEDDKTPKDSDTMYNSNDGKTGNGVMVGGALMIPTRDIVDNASFSADHTTLISALKAADMANALDTGGPYTVFAPTNAAFDKLPAGSLDNMVKPENKALLGGILKYHVVQGEYKSTDITDGMTLTTLQGQTLTFTKKDDQWLINGTAMITVPDIVSSNGITHVIDTVLMPQ